jgi:hypothetical protein
METLGWRILIWRNILTPIIRRNLYQDKYFHHPKFTNPTSIFLGVEDFYEKGDNLLEEEYPWVQFSWERFKFYKISTIHHPTLKIVVFMMEYYLIYKIVYNG